MSDPIPHLADGMRADAAPPCPALPRASFAQSRMWLLDQLEPGSSAYNVPAAWRMRGTLDIPLLARCLREIVGRHEVLRTTLHLSEGILVQDIAGACADAFALEVVDLRGRPDAAAAARAHANAAAEQPFDLARGPLLRAGVVRIADDDHLFHLVIHHAAADAWSIGVLLDELVRLYDAWGRGSDVASPLDPLPLQYADFAEWQHDWLQGETLQAQLAHWTEALRDAPERIDLPTDRPRPAVRSTRGGHVPFALGTGTVHALRELARDQRCTLFMVLATGLAALLHRMSGQDDLCIGYPVAGRDEPELEHLVGLFTNTLVLRVQPADDDSFTSLLAQVRERVLAGGEHAGLPFERLVEALCRDRALSHAPLFQVMLSLDNTGLQRLALPSLELQPLGSESTTAKFDLGFDLVELDGILQGEIEYSSDLFDEATVRRLAGRLVRLLDAAAAAPRQRLLTLPLTSDAEGSELAASWRASPPAPAFEPVHRSFERRAAQAPRAIALLAGERELTYAELDARSARLARELHARGVRPGMRVGVCFERSVELVVAILGVLRTGAAYVPLDPDYPMERLAWMCGDPCMSWVAAHPAHVDHLPIARERCLLVDESGPAPLLAPAPDVRLYAGHPIYVIYTSGSTGRPKGAVNTQAGFANLVEWFRKDVLDRGPRDARVIVATSPSFDTTQKLLLGPLAHGAAVVLPAGPVADVEAFEAAVLRHRPTMICATPSALRLLTRDLAGPRIGQVMIGGESIEPGLAARLLEQEVQLVHAYGPTECADIALWHEVRRQTTPRRIPLGTTVPGTHVYVLDAAFRPVPADVIGEIYIAGIGVAHNYDRQPAQTAERFLPDPFGPPGSRMYATGDLGRHRADGLFEFIGRADQQVKIRGLRIELQEIEAALVADAAVADAAVGARPSPQGEPTLVAWVVLRAAGHDVRSLAARLRATLPAFMVPTRWVALEALPLNAHGKVDRRALHVPADAPGADDGTSRVAPRTATERVVAESWCRVLNRETVGMDEDFFHAGGHSLSAAQVLSRLRAAFGRPLTLRDLFDARTPQALAALIDGRAPAAGATGEMFQPITRRADATAPASFAQARMWFQDRWLPGRSTYHVPLAWRLRGRLDDSALCGALQAVVDRHEALRTRFEVASDDDDVPRQVVSPAAPIALDTIDLATAPHADASSVEARLASLAREMAGRPFDLARGPLLRPLLVRLGVDDHALLVTVHHIVFDGRSAGILAGELAHAYGALRRGEMPGLPPLPVQAADHAAWQRAAPQRAEIERQVAAWRDALADAPPILALPWDRPRPPVSRLRGAALALELGSARAARIRSACASMGVTPFAFVATAISALLHRYSGQDDVCIGYAVANRTRPELDRLIGLFVNTLVLRTRHPGGQRLGELLLQVRSTLVDNDTRQDAPFDQVVAALRPGRSLNSTPLFQVMLTLLEDTGAGLALDGQAVQDLPVPCDSTKFDLTFDLAWSKDRLGGVIEYDTDLFDRTTIERLAAHLAAVVDALLDSPATPVDATPLASAAEIALLCGPSGWGAGTEAAEDNRCLHELFSAQAARAPDAVAIRSAGRSVTYAALDALSDRVADDLLGLGVRPDDRVLVFAGRGIDTIAALIGVLKAGGAYLPLGIDTPRERIAALAQEAGVLVALADPAHAATLDGLLPTVRPLRIDAGSSPRPPARPRITPDHLAYCLFTSGSTGRPKAVATTHRNVRRLASRMGYVSVDEGSVFLQAAPLAFDAATFEIWACLINGGRLVLAPPGRVSVDALRDQVQQEGVTHLWLTSALFDRVCESRLEALSSVRELFAGGDVLSVHTVRRVLDALPACRLVNGYGPTETTTFATTHPFPRDFDGDAAPIGRPIDHTRVQVLDAGQRPVPIGVPGELYIGGAGVARGYLGRPAATAEAFVPDRAGAPGSRLYRTGDLARWRPDGTLAFLGRRDHQVKIRGYRIEPGEVETALLACPGVAAACVVPHAFAADDRRLVAYVCPAGQGATPAAIQAALKARLPDYLIPGAWVLLDALPVTANGKVDRARLPAPEAAVGAGAGATVEAPATPTEAVLVALWARTLQRDDVGIDHDFFALGGHSLIAVRLVAQVQRELPRRERLALEDLFRHPSPRALGALLDARAPAGLADTGDLPDGPAWSPAIVL